MPDLRTARRKLQIAFVALGIVDLAAVVVLVTPIAGSQAARRQELGSLWKQLQLETRQVEPLRDMDKKITQAQQQIDHFYADRLPTQESAISEALGRVATDTGVKLEGAKYTVKDPQPVGLRAVEVEAQLSGNYLQLVRCINSLERDQLFFIVDSVDLSGQQAGIVKLHIKLETYWKTGMEPGA